MQDVGSVQLRDLRRPLLLLSRSMYVHAAEGLRGNHTGQHRRPGEFRPVEPPAGFRFDVRFPLWKIWTPKLF